MTALSTWAENNPAAFVSRFVGNEYGSGRYFLTPPAAARYSERIRRSDESSMEVAEAEHCSSVPNVRFSLQSVSRDLFFEFDIYTAQNGSQQGKRLIKLKIDGRYKAVAYLLRNGGFRMWSRFGDDDQLAIAISDALAFIRHNTVMAGAHEDIQGTSNPVSPDCWQFTVHRFTCRVCNGEAHRTSRHFCRSHLADRAIDVTGAALPARTVIENPGRGNVIFTALDNEGNPLGPVGTATNSAEAGETLDIDLSRPSQSERTPPPERVIVPLLSQVDGRSIR